MQKWIHKHNSLDTQKQAEAISCFSQTSPYPQQQNPQALSASGNGPSRPYSWMRAALSLVFSLSLVLLPFVLLSQQVSAAPSHPHAARSLQASLGTWVLDTSPNPGYPDRLMGVAAVSATDAWAVGYYGDALSGTYQPLIEHWDGQTWEVSASATPGLDTNAFLSGVAVVSPNDAWAVGVVQPVFSSGVAPSLTALVEHWNGTDWQLIPAANPGSSLFLVNRERLYLL